MPGAPKDAAVLTMIRILTVVVHFCPTWIPRRELSGREGVTAECLGAEDARAFQVAGPCCVTVNRD